MALFSNIFSLETSARIWDQYLYHGDFFLVKVAIAICLSLSEQMASPNLQTAGGQMIAQLSSQGQFEMMVLLFKNIKTLVTEEMLFNALDNAICKLGPEDYDKIKKQIEAYSNLERLI